MANEDRGDVPMARPDRPREKDAVRTTIVGGRPPGSGTDIGPIPRGIEVLVKKASVDAEFRALLLERRAEAAEAIALELEPAEAMMLDAVPAAQLEAIIGHTTVSPMTRQAFLGRAAGVMLAALGASVAIEPIDAEAATSRGIRPPAPKGIRPDPVVRYAVYGEKDYKGDATYEVIETRAYRANAAKVQQTNRWLKAAYAQAAKLWGKDPNNEGVAFPMKAPQAYRCRLLTSYSDRQTAEADVKKRREALDQQRKLDEEKEKNRLAALSDEPRKKEEQKAQRLKAAQQLFEARLRALIRPPMPITGIVPDVPRPTRGIQPDRP